MKLFEFTTAAGTKKKPMRKGRGTGSGNGKTAGKGHKGQNARAGGGVRIGFEGGQMPLYRRVPKRGFNNKRFADVYAEVSVSAFNIFENGAVITEEAMVEKGLFKKIYDGVVVLGNGQLDKKVTVQATRFTKSASEIIESAGGKAEVV